MKRPKTATLKIGDKKIILPVIDGTENQAGIDIRTLHEKTGYYAYDNGFANTSSCLSNITFVDGEKGILRYRGYDIEDLVKHCSFVEVSYLLVNGELPTHTKLNNFSNYLNELSLIHEDMHFFFTGFPASSHPMAIMSAMVTSLSSFYPHLSHKDPSFDITIARLLSKVRTIAAFSYRKSQGDPVVYPKHELSYCANFLNMMFSSPVYKYEIDPFVVKALNQLFILHADHEQNCSTSAVRLVASARANVYAAISAGISALWGPYHGGANQSVIEMLQAIKNDGISIKKVIEKAKDKKNPFRLMGFGHAIYKNYDPRAKTIKKICDELLTTLKVSDPLLNIARELEEAALKDSYFKEKRLYPNVDFYSGIAYRAMGFPTEMLTVLFLIGRLPGWIAQWKEESDASGKLWRPKQVYIGPNKREFIPLVKRKE